MKPAHIIRFEKLLAKGKVIYVLSTALFVAVLIAAIQFFAGESLVWQRIGLYALIGAAIALVDWLVLSWRYNQFDRSSDESKK